MKDLQDVFTTFKKEFPAVHEEHETLGRTILEQAGPLPEKMRRLIKTAVSGACGRALALETHIAKARGREQPRTRSNIRCP